MKNSKKLYKYLVSKVGLVVKKRTCYTPLKREEYLSKFGIAKDVIGWKVIDKDLLTNAYTKAWENRNYEIDKFWTRAAYFWGFLVLIFGGYISILTSERNEQALNMRLDLYLVLLGFLFSLSWYLVILGSKCWQQNWEAHIDALENFVSGPIYKTIFYSGKRFYSVSKLNEVMALIVFIVWCSLFTHYIYENFRLTTKLERIDIRGTFSIVIALVFAIGLRFGYTLGDYRSEKKSFFDRWE